MRAFPTPCPFAILPQTESPADSPALSWGTRPLWLGGGRDGASAPGLKEIRDRAVMNVHIYAQLRAAGRDKKQATLMAVLIPDWSQWATKADLAPLTRDLRRLALGQSRMQDRLLRKQSQMILWVGGLLLGLPPLWLWLWTAVLPAALP